MPDVCLASFYFFLGVHSSACVKSDCLPEVITYVLTSTQLILFLMMPFTLTSG